MEDSSTVSIGINGLTDIADKYCNILNSNGYNCGIYANQNWLYNNLNSIKLFFSGTLNNRDPRKIWVIDGKVAFSGGINLADEYINVVQRFGYWKDTAFKTTGDVVLSYTYMFTEFWNAFSKEKILKEYLKLSENKLPQKKSKKSYYIIMNP